MPRRNDDLLDIGSIVPDTEARNAGRAKPAPRQTASRSSNSTAPLVSMGTVWQAMAGIALVGLAATSAYFYYQFSQQQVLNQQLQTRLATVESQLGLASSNEATGTETLGSKVRSLDEGLKSANDEIRKLWAITNDKNRKALESHETRLDDQKKALDSLQVTLGETRKSLALAEKAANDAARQAGDNDKSVAGLNQSLTEMRTTVGNLQQRISQGDPAAREASQQAALAQEQAEQVQAKVDGLSRKISEHDEALKSIDTFRRSVNSDLNKLKGTSSGGYNQTYP